MIDLLINGGIAIVTSIVTWIINIIDLYIGIPINDLEYLCLQMIVAGISLFIILYFYLKRK